MSDMDDRWRKNAVDGEALAPLRTARQLVAARHRWLPSLTSRQRWTLWSAAFFGWAILTGCASALPTIGGVFEVVFAISLLPWFAFRPDDEEDEI